MKTKTFVSILFLTLISLSFTLKYEIEKCFINFSNHSDLTVSTVDRLPDTSEKVRKLKTESGEVEVTRIDGYRVLYNNNKNVPFVNLKVELSDKKYYDNDQKGLIENLKYLNKNSIGMETTDLIELEFNGYKIYGFSRGIIEQGSTLGTFVMFPGNGVTVYYYFNNLKPEYRNFETVEEYKIQRDKFIEEYTRHLSNCKMKK